VTVTQTIDHETGLIVHDDHALVPLTEVESFLSTRPPVDTAKELRDRLAALCTYYKGKVEVYNELYEGQLRTERYIGQMLAKIPSAKTGPKLPDTMSGNLTPTLKDLGFTDKQSSRLQQLASVPEEKFNSYIEAKKDATERIVKADLLDKKAMSQAMRTLTSEATEDWYTPPGIIERARAVLGNIDLDPASSAVAQQWIAAERYYTADVPHGQWAGRVWLNPPFDDTPAWVDRLEAAYDAGDVTAAVLLVNSAPGYVWWEELWRRRPVCMLRERLSFYTADGTPGGQAKKGTTIAYYGPDVARFVAGFRDLGRLFLPGDER
jgi:hypothetical protein